MIIKKLQKGHSRKKQENKGNLVGLFNRQIMYLATLIFGSELMLLFVMF